MSFYGSLKGNLIFDHEREVEVSYFVFRLILSLGLSILLLSLLLYLARYCKLRNLKKKIAFFFPTILSIALLFQVLLGSGPKGLDFLPMVGSRYEVSQVEVVEIYSFHRVLMNDGVTYYYNGFSQTFEVGELYQISSTPWSHYIVEFKII